MKLIMIRHTKPDVPEGVFYGQTDVPLAESFNEEAQAVKHKLQQYQFDTVYCSPLSRCSKLAEYCGMKDIKYDPRLMELNFGEWEMAHYQKITDPRLQQWYADYINVRTPGGESFADQGKRLIDFLSDLKSTAADTVAIFTHGGIIMQAMVLFGKATPENVFFYRPDYGAVVEFELSSEA